MISVGPDVIAAIGGRGVDDEDKLPTDVQIIGADSKSKKSGNKKIDVSDLQYSFISILSKRVKIEFQIAENDGRTTARNNETQLIPIKSKETSPNKKTKNESSYSITKTTTTTSMTEKNEEAEKMEEKANEQKTGVYFSIDSKTVT